jgi:ribosomal protein L30/L7E
MGLHRSGGEAVLSSDSSFRQLLNIVSDHVQFGDRQK